MTQSTQNRLVNLLFDNVRIVFLLFLFVVIFGTAAFASLDRQGFPEVNINIAIVNVPYPNASALQVEEQVIKPLEDVLDEESTVESYESFAMDNFGNITVTFDESADLDASIAKIQDGFASADLPDDIGDVDVNKISISGPVFTLGVSGPTDPAELYDVTEQVKLELEDIHGVKSVELSNAPLPEIWLTFDDEALQENGLTRDAVEGALQLAQFEAPVGKVVDENGDETLISLAKEVNTVEDLKQLLVGPGVELQDVAEVDVVLNNNDRYNRVGFRDEQDDELSVVRAIMLLVSIDADADILSVDDELQARLTQMQDEAQFEGVDVTMFYSQADDTRVQIEEITSSVFGQKIEALGPLGFIGYLFGAITLVLILLFFFMNARVAILAATAVPLSLIGTSMYLALMGIQLNTLVLFSMVLAIGLVVDPTIVFLESLQRYKEQGMNGRDAAGKTMNTVGWGVTLAVLTNLMVFIPFGIVSGFFGEIIKYIPATIIPAMIASELVPVIFLTPFASRFLKPRKNMKLDPNVDPELQGTWKIATKTGSLVSWLLEQGKMRGALRVLIVFLGFTMPFAISGGLIAVGALELVQFSDGGGESDYVIVTGDLPEDMDFDTAVYEVVVPVQDMLKEYPEVKKFQYYEQYGNDFMMFVTLYDLPTRKENEWRPGPDLIADMTADIEALNLDADVKAETNAEGPPDAASGVQVRLFDRDLVVLADASADIVAFLQTVEGVKEAKSNLDGGDGGNVTFVLDNGQEVNQNPMLVYGLLSSAIAESDLGTITLDGLEYEVQSVGEKQTATIESLEDLPLPGVQGASFGVPGLPTTGAVTAAQETEVATIGDVLKEERASDAVTIRRLEGRRYVQISAELEEDADAFAIQKELDDYLTEEKLVELGLAADAKDFAGAADSITKSFTELLIALVIAIFMIYVLLVGFFKSFLEPFIIIFAIPLGLIGVALSLAVTVGQIGFLELLGVVAMAGIVVNVTILLIDFANQMKAEGKSPAEAISTSVAVRFRPIMLTQLTAFGSLMPLMIYSPFWKGLAGAIIFGIISSALLSLFMTPILYVWAQKAERLPSKVHAFIQSKRKRA